MILTLSPVFDVTDVNFKQNKKKRVHQSYFLPLIYLVPIINYNNFDFHLPIVLNNYSSYSILNSKSSFMTTSSGIYANQIRFRIFEQFSLS
jgi:hypothetical protein